MPDYSQVRALRQEREAERLREQYDSDETETDSDESSGPTTSPGASRQRTLRQEREAEQLEDDPDPGRDSGEEETSPTRETREQQPSTDDQTIGGPDASRVRMLRQEREAEQLEEDPIPGSTRLDRVSPATFDPTVREDTEAVDLREQFDPTTEADISPLDLPDAQEEELRAEAAGELSVDESEVRFAEQDGQVIVYRDPEAAASEYRAETAADLGVDADDVRFAERQPTGPTTAPSAMRQGRDGIEEVPEMEGGLIAYPDADVSEAAYRSRLAENLGVRQGDVSVSDSGEVRVTGAGERAIEADAREQVAAEASEYDPGDIVADVQEGGGVETRVSDSALEREVIEQLRAENPDADIDREDVEITRQEGGVRAEFVGEAPQQEFEGGFLDRTVSRVYARAGPGASLLGTEEREEAVEAAAREEGSLSAGLFVGGEVLEDIGVQGTEALDETIPEFDRGPRVGLFAGGEGERVGTQVRNLATGVPATAGFLAGLGPKAVGDIGLRVERQFGVTDVDEAATPDAPETARAVGTAGVQTVESIQREPVGFALGIAAPTAGVRLFGRARSRAGRFAEGYEPSSPREFVADNRGQIQTGRQRSSSPDGGDGARTTPSQRQTNPDYDPRVFEGVGRRPSGRIVGGDDALQLTGRPPRTLERSQQFAQRVRAQRAAEATEAAEPTPTTSTSRGFEAEAAGAIAGASVPTGAEVGGLLAEDTSSSLPGGPDLVENIDVDATGSDLQQASLVETDRQLLSPQATSAGPLSRVEEAQSPMSDEPAADLGPATAPGLDERGLEDLDTNIRGRAAGRTAQRTAQRTGIAQEAVTAESSRFGRIRQPYRVGRPGRPSRPRRLDFDLPSFGGDGEVDEDERFTSDSELFEFDFGDPLSGDLPGEADNAPSLPGLGGF